MAADRQKPIQLKEIRSLGRTLQVDRHIVFVRCYGTTEKPDRYEICLLCGGETAVVDVKGLDRSLLEQRISDAITAFVESLRLRGL
jgi:hypothetical protein